MAGYPGGAPDLLARQKNAATKQKKLLRQNQLALARVPQRIDFARMLDQHFALTFE
jgi:hypothetical protein